MSIAPTSEDYHQSMYLIWGPIGSTCYIVIPTVFVIIAILIFISEVHFLQRKARRKRVRYTLYWILGKGKKFIESSVKIITVQLRENRKW
jgi:hypothetical protein